MFYFVTQFMKIILKYCGLYLGERFKLIIILQVTNFYCSAMFLTYRATDE